MVSHGFLDSVVGCGDFKALLCGAVVAPHSNKPAHGSAAEVAVIHILAEDMPEHPSPSLSSRRLAVVLRASEKVESKLIACDRGWLYGIVHQVARRRFGDDFAAERGVA